MFTQIIVILISFKTRYWQVWLDFALRQRSTLNLHKGFDAWIKPSQELGKDIKVFLHVGISDFVTTWQVFSSHILVMDLASPSKWLSNQMLVSDSIESTIVKWAVLDLCKGLSESD